MYAQANRTGDPTERRDHHKAYPVIVWKALQQDFGFVKKGERVTARFEFTNLGHSPVEIMKVIGDCSCLSITYSQAPIQPQKQGWIEVTLIPKESKKLSCTLRVGTTSAQLVNIIELAAVVKGE